MNYSDKYEIVKLASFCEQRSRNSGLEKQATPLGVAFAGMEGYNAYKNFRQGNILKGIGNLGLGALSLVPGVGVIRTGLAAGKLGTAGVRAAKAGKGIGGWFKGLFNKGRGAANTARTTNTARVPSQAVLNRAHSNAVNKFKTNVWGKGNRARTVAAAGAGGALSYGLDQKQQNMMLQNHINQMNLMGGGMPDFGQRMLSAAGSGVGANPYRGFSQFADKRYT